SSAPCWTGLVLIGVCDTHQAAPVRVHDEELPAETVLISVALEDQAARVRGPSKLVIELQVIREIGTRAALGRDGTYVADCSSTVHIRAGISDQPAVRRPVWPQIRGEYRRL